MEIKIRKVSIFIYKFYLYPKNYTANKLQEVCKILWQQTGENVIGKSHLLKVSSHFGTVKKKTTQKAITAFQSGSIVYNLRPCCENQA